MKPAQFNSLLLVLSLFLLSCAGQRPPEGGPIDTEPPQIISTTPAAFTTFFSDTILVFEFSEYVDQRSVESAIFISPNVGPLEFEWNGRKVEILLPGKLRDSTTYVVTIGTDVVDLNNRNRMATSFLLAFSTGKAIDRGAIEGKIFQLNPADSPSGIMVFAYRLDGVKADTLNPQSASPAYITQTSHDGSFALNHLSFGWYRLFAVKDEFKNLLYDPETDLIGVPPSDIFLGESDTLYSDVHIQMTKADTTSPRLLKVESPDQRHMIVEFSETIDTSLVRTEFAQVTDTLNGKPLTVYSFDALLPKMNLFSFSTNPMTPDAPYRIRISSLRDLAGNIISPLANAASFTGPSLVDSLPLRIAWMSLQDSAKGIALQPEIVINFSDVVQRETILGAVTMQSARKLLIPFSLEWISNTAILIKPTQQLESAEWHSFRIHLHNVLGMNGKRPRDSVRVISFQTMDRERFSSIHGRVQDSEVRGRKGSIIITAMNVSAKDAASIAVTASPDGQFAITDLVEGKYSLRAFHDRNGNGKYDYGTVYPFSASERFTQYRDTVRVRARWPLEGIQLELR
ncbi:MAG: Ig-like domain-containing protein [bacterium]